MGPAARLAQRGALVQQQRVQQRRLHEQVAQARAGGQVEHGQRGQRAQRRDHQLRQVGRAAQRLCARRRRRLVKLGSIRRVSSPLPASSGRTGVRGRAARRCVAAQQRRRTGPGRGPERSCACRAPPNQRKAARGRRQRTSRASSGGVSRTSSARKASRAAWQPGSSTARHASSRRSRSAPCVGQVLASGRSAGEKSSTPLATAWRRVAACWRGRGARRCGQLFEQAAPGASRDGGNGLAAHTASKLCVMLSK